MSIFESLGGQQPTGMQGLLAKLQQFAATFRGDPQQQVQQLISSGRVTQEQLNQAMATANQLQQMVGKFR